MLKYVLLACVVASAFAVPTAIEDNDCSELFQQFLDVHPRDYANDLTESARREAIFCNNVKTLLTGAEWEGVTEFFDMTMEEFAMQKLNAGLTTDAATVTRNCLKNNASQPHFYETNDLPASFDWRTKGAVTSVKNQASCGSCWAFSTAGTMEGQVFLKTGKLVDLSPQDLVDCSKDCSWEIFPPGSGTNVTVCDGGCGGGWPWMAYESIRKQGGLDTEASYPYKGVAGTCAVNNKTLVGPVKNFTCVSSDEDQIAAFLMQRGPLSIAVNANPLMSYKSGILTPPNGTSKVMLNHAILLVGFGEETAEEATSCDTKGKFNCPASTTCCCDKKSIFGHCEDYKCCDATKEVCGGNKKGCVPAPGPGPAPTGGKYWIVKNSWGTTWGEKGYVRVARGIGALGINNAVSTADLA